MYLVLLLAAGAVLGGVVVVAMGRGGQIAIFRPDIPVPALRFRTPDDVALAKLPLALFGYQVQATGDALAAAAALVDERDAQIAELRRELLRLTAFGPGGSAGPAGSAEPAVAIGGVSSDSGEPESDDDAGLTAEPGWRQ